VSKEICLDDKTMLNKMAFAATSAGSTVIDQCRYRFGHDSPPGFTCFVLLDESHLSAHSYADEGMIALDIFTCGDTDPREIWTMLSRYICEHAVITEFPRF
jgi:S-adenosylmethionine decarboxylase